MAQASGTNVTLAFAREASRGTTPAAVGTLTDTIAAAADGGASGRSKFTRAAGSFVTDGFVAGQWVKTTGFTLTPNNGNWKVYSVSALELVVLDSGDVIADEIADAAQKVQILLTEIRATSRNVNPTKNILESAEVRSDRQKRDVRHGFTSVAGGFGFELSRGAYDDILELLLSRAWTPVTVSGGPTFGVNSAGYFTRSAGSWITDGFRKGDIIRSSAFSNGVNNGDFRVTAVAASNLTVDTDGATFITEASGGTIVYPGQRLDVGSVLSTMTMERAFTDVVQYQVFLGVVLNELALSIQPEAIVGGTFSLLGITPQALAGASISDTDPVSPDQNAPYAAFDGTMHEGGSQISVVTGVEFSVTNNRTLNPVVGSKYSPDVFEGTLEITGTLTAFFQDATLLNKFINETLSTMWIKLLDIDDSTHFMSFVFPRVKYNGGDMDPPQQGPVPLSMPFRALVEVDLAADAGTTVNSCLTIQRSNS